MNIFVKTREMNSWHLYLMAALYVTAGAVHFLRPQLYLRIIPEYLPYHKALVYLSGLAEIILGIGVCFTITRNYALYGLIILLIIFMLVHIYMFKNKKTGIGLPKWVLIIRFLLQFVLIWWAWSYLNFQEI